MNLFPCLLQTYEGKAQQFMIHSFLTHSGDYKGEQSIGQAI